MKIKRLRMFGGFLGLVYSLSVFLVPIPTLSKTVGAPGDYVALTPLALTEGETGIDSENNFNGCTKKEISGVWDPASKTRTTPPSCLPKYLRYVYNTGILLAGFLAVFSIVRGGFYLLFTDSILGHSEGKGIILRALGGLLIVYSSFILMNQINPQLGADLNLSLDYKQITIIKPKVQLVPTAESVEATLRRQLDTVNPQIRSLREQADEKQRLAEQATDPVMKQALQKEADDLKEEYTLLGDINAPSERIKKAHMNALDTLWNTSKDAKSIFLGIPFGALSKIQRLNEAIRLRGDMEKEREKIEALPAGPSRDAVLKELNDTEAAIDTQIHYLYNDCDQVGKKHIETYIEGVAFESIVDCPAQ